MTTAQAFELDRAVSLFHALSDPIRLSILQMLRGKLDELPKG